MINTNLITTKCTDCVFLKKGCKAGKTTFCTADGVFNTDGFCRLKRTDKWIEKNSVDAKTDKRIELAMAEECNISVLVCGTSKTPEQIITTIDSVDGGEHSYIKEIIVVLVNSEIEDTKVIANRLSKLKGVAWKLETIKADESETMSEWYIVDYALRLVTKSNWFISLFGGDVITSKQLEFISSMLRFKTNNTVAFYFDQNDAFKVVTNKFAFAELDGNIELPWFEKIKTFDNWEKVCLKVE